MPMNLKLVAGILCIMISCRSEKTDELPSEVEKHPSFSQDKLTYILLINPYTCQACNAETSQKMHTLLQKDQSNLNTIILTPGIRKVELEHFFSEVMPVDRQKTPVIVNDNLFHELNRLTGRSTKINYIFVYGKDRRLKGMQPFEEFVLGKEPLFMQP